MEQPEVGDSFMTFLDDSQPQPKSGEGSLCSSEGQKLSNLMRSYAISINRVDKRDGELWLSLSVTPGQVISTLLLPTNADTLELTVIIGCSTTAFNHPSSSTLRHIAFTIFYSTNSHQPSSSFTMEYDGYKITDYPFNNFPCVGMAMEFSVKDIDGRDMKDLKGRGWVRISGIENSDSYMAEGGRGWVVECSYGATNDNSEPMIQYDECQHWYNNACCGLKSSMKHNGYWRCPDCMLLPSDIDNFNLLVDASLCDLEKQIGKENHAEHASQCAPEQGLDKENRAEHAPLCVLEKCIEKEYQEILSFRNRNVLSKLSLEEQKLIEGYWTDAAQTGEPMIQYDECQHWYNNACCGLNSSMKHNGYWRCPDCMLLPSDIDNFNLLADASLCDLEKQIGKENHAEHASQCAPEQGLDKENRAEHAPLCVLEKCIEKEYQEILSFRNRNVLSKLSLEEQKHIEGYWTDAAQTGCFNFVHNMRQR
ncbi:hypothetical protein D8674_004031 [Pyrus ussuriensis x Pyrus communis]|uniref:Uncharacterized protein n=1 Tax=Pyrus ussuriensis x Pyrus communis TaxID=2448454 RepID=A0A5N5FIQ6_9ROSA|nr:hypothetical protein D8674_004031 [Pyrus ussuriensis x Pyrus communis]